MNGPYFVVSLYALFSVENWIILNVIAWQPPPWGLLFLVVAGCFNDFYKLFL